MTQAEYERLLGKYQPNLLVTGVDGVTVSTDAGVAPVLPNTVTVHYGDGRAENVAVTWPTIDPAQYATGGTFTVEADVVAGSSHPAVATVTVIAPVTFSDVTETTAFADAIAWAAGNGIVNGYTDGTFRPQATISREAVAAMLFRSANPGQTAAACVERPFSDVSLTNPFCGEISWLKSEGISFGNADGTFGVGKTLSRQAAAAFIARTFGPETLPTCTTAPFGDVGVGNPFCAEINWAATEGITTGYPDNTFRGGLSVTRQAFVAFLYREAGLSD